MSYERPTYTDGYEIRYDCNDDMFHCWKNETHLKKKDGKPSAYKALGLAVKYMAAAGAKEATPEPKTRLWTPPPPANIASLADQLAALPADAPRFVVVEAGYGTYREQGYAVYDREDERIICPLSYNGWNFVTQNREEAEREAASQNANPQEKIEADLYLFNQMLTEDEKDEYQEIQPGSKEEATYKRQESYWQERLAQMQRVPERTKKAEEEDEKKDAHFVTDRKYVVAEMLVAKDGHAYIVTEDSWWLSERDVDNLDDQDVFGAQPGWQTKVKVAQ